MQLMHLYDCFNIHIHVILFWTLIDNINIIHPIFGPVRLHVRGQTHFGTGELPILFAGCV